MRLQSSSSKQARQVIQASIDMVAGNCAVAMSPQTSCAPQHDANALFAFNVFAGPTHTNYRSSAFKPVMQLPGDMRPVAGQARRVPKVPSMLFDLEMEESTRVVHDDVEARHTVYRVQALSRPTTLSAQVAADVECAAHISGYSYSDASHLAQALVTMGYPAASISIRHSLGGGDGGQCLRNLRHTFLCLSLDMDAGDSGMEGTSSDHQQRDLQRTLSTSSFISTTSNSSSSDSMASTFTTNVIIDPFFREQFEVPVASSRYASLVAALPAVYVGTQEHLVPLVELMCEEMSRAFLEAGSLLPPWRRTKSMLSKWLPRRSCDLSLLQLATAGAAAEAVGSSAAASVAGSGTAAGLGGVVAELVRQSSSGRLQASAAAAAAQGSNMEQAQPLKDHVTGSASAVAGNMREPQGKAVHKVFGGLSRALSNAADAAGSAALAVGQSGYGFVAIPRERSPTRVMLEPMQRVVGGNFVPVPSELPQEI